MREIIFRGKRIAGYNDNTPDGTWVYGSLFVDRKGQTKIKWHCEKFGAAKTSNVDPNTVGQFTGMLDCNGRKIFEGDIIKFSDMGIYPVWWDADDCAFGSCWFSDFDHLSKYRGVKMEVIGNIHDNPELLDQGE